MALSTCIKCGGNTFEIQAAELSDSSYKIMFVQCANCGGVIGALDLREVKVASESDIENNGTANFHLNHDTYQLKVGTEIIQLTSTETGLLAYFIDNPNRTSSPGELLQKVWEYPPNTGDPDLVRAHIRNLRAKLSRTQIDKKLDVRTIHGVGWMLSINASEG